MTLSTHEQRLLIAIAKAQREAMRELAQQADEAGMKEVAKYRHGLVNELNDTLKPVQQAITAAGFDLHPDQHTVQPQPKPDWGANRGSGQVGEVPAQQNRVPA